MIIEIHEDTVRLSGSLRSNQWLTIKSVIDLLSRHHPRGIVIDCKALEMVSREGMATFIQAMHHIAASKMPLTVAHLPCGVLAEVVAKWEMDIPLPVAETVEDARIALVTSTADWWERLWGAGFPKGV